MTDILELPFKAENGKPPTAVLHRLLDAVAKMDGKRMVLTLKEQKRLRSSNQNRYYWGVVIPPIVRMFRDHGNPVDAQDVHEFLKLRVGKLSLNLVTPAGEVVKSLGSTTKLDKQEMEVYLERVRAFAAENGVAIPLPHEELPETPPALGATQRS